MTRENIDNVSAYAHAFAVAIAALSGCEVSRAELEDALAELADLIGDANDSVPKVALYGRR